MDILRVIDDLPDEEVEAGGLLGVVRRAKTGRGYADHAELMRARHADPVFAAEHRERGRRHMKRLNADPKFKAQKLERLRDLNNDPEFKERSREAARQAQLRRWAKWRESKKN